MSPRVRPGAPSLSLLLIALALLALLALAPRAAAGPLADDGGAEWRVEQPLPPAPEEPGVEPSSTPVSLGRIGDIEFWEPSPGIFAPNRGALITSGNGGSVKPGVWLYDGSSWRELSNQCGATDGRIAWAGPDEFWTVSDGRAGQQIVSGSQLPPLADNTLCHFAPGPGGNLEIVASYASPPFEANSYRAMHAAGCLTPQDCWFGGEPLEAPQVGAFMLHWNGASVEAHAYLPEGHAVRDMRPFEGRLFESMRLESTDPVVKAVRRPPPLRTIMPTSSPEESPFESVLELPLYSKSESPLALDSLHLSASEGSLWAAAGPQETRPPETREAAVTIIRKTAEGWARVIAPQAEEGTVEEELKTPPPGANAFPANCQSLSQPCYSVLNSIAGEPGSSSAWVALDSSEDARDPSTLARASLARVSSEGAVSDRLELPLPEDPHGPLGTAERVVCPAEHDCWATTKDGWLLHLSDGPAESGYPSPASDPVFASIEAGEPITFRPHDQGVPQEPSDELPENNSGEVGFTRDEEVIKPPIREPAKVPVPLLTDVHTHLLHGRTLVLSFHLAVKARVRLEAMRHKKVIARTAKETLKAGNRKLELKLDPKRWPEHLHLETHALAPLPTQSTAAPNVTSVSTSFVAPARLLSTGLIF